MKKKQAKARPKAGTSKESSAKRRIKFIGAYLTNGGNATDAAKAAGYAPRSAYNAGARLMKDDEVRASIRKDAKDVAEKVGLTVERTLREVARLAYSDPRRFYKPDGTLIPIHELDDDTAATIASVEVDEIKAGEAGVVGHTTKIKHWDKNSAIEKAMKYHGLFKKDNEQPRPPQLNIGLPGAKDRTPEEAYLLVLRP